MGFKLVLLDPDSRFLLLQWFETFSELFGPHLGFLTHQCIITGNTQTTDKTYDESETEATQKRRTVKILIFGTPQTIAIIVLKIEKFDVTLH